MNIPPSYPVFGTARGNATPLAGSGSPSRKTFTVTTGALSSMKREPLALAWCPSESWALTVKPSGPSALAAALVASRSKKNVPPSCEAKKELLEPTVSVGLHARVGLRVGRDLDVRARHVHARRGLAGEARGATREAIVRAHRADVLGAVAGCAGRAIGIGIAMAQVAGAAAGGEQEDGQEEGAHGQKAKASRSPDAISTPPAANSTFAARAAEFPDWRLDRSAGR